MEVKYLITGGAGFIGSFLCEKVVESGGQFICIDNLFRGRKENINKYIGINGSSFHNIDILSSASTSSICELILEYKPDYILHYAAINGTQYFYDMPFETLSVNSVGTYNLLYAINQAKQKNNTIEPVVVFSSSSEVYGSAKNIPTNENDQTYLRVNEDRDSYAAGKLISEFYVRNFCNSMGLGWIIFRIFNVYGPRMVGSKYGQVIPEFIERLNNGEHPLKIIGDGNHTRSFCYIDDHIDLTWRALNAAIKNEVYNIGNPIEIKIIDLASIIMKKMKLKVNYEFLSERSGDHKRRVPDISKLIKEVGEFDFISLENGIQKLI
jgi:UDP-glucuronate decarboxylase